MLTIKDAGRVRARRGRMSCRSGPTATGLPRWAPELGRGFREGLVRGNRGGAAAPRKA